ncbi:pyruvate carboxylase [Miniphocaeibacter massiliensis]|uniref:pyruvate carboxylase n=1 Tax=Miniphocaeibacter massiliensis TaxID=2041841 RepID=UPI000C1B88CA|nr:pyruvate carboxylase [Miniphocaeibacter massiliensis]
MAKKFKKILVANRGEIAVRIFRACSELGIRSVAIYSEEDNTALFRTKADESYEVGFGKTPLEAYLDMNEIISLAKNKGVDAIHPGYGFLSENKEFARRCEENGITFIGPSYNVLDSLGDKIKSKIVAKKAEVPTIPGVDKPIRTKQDALDFAKEAGYPVMIKAAAGGGGRGMRIVEKEEDLIPAFRNAQSEAKKAFGIDDMFIEKYLKKPKHIEVQILGDKHGNIVHLFERDCSIQRRHQKIIEYTPAFSLPTDLREKICEDALKIAKSVDYYNAGTVEFLVDADLNHYFIEVNPRVQVEHTVTELVTGIDIVQSQILIAEGHSLDSDEIGIRSQDDIKVNGYSIQCRVTTEDPANDFAPDTGKIDVYRSGSGFGVRLDVGNAYVGSVVTPFYDSLLVKITSKSRTFKDTINKSKRALKELKISGVKTNIPFLVNVLNSEQFQQGTCNTGFIENNPQLFDVKPRNDRELKVLNFIGENVVNNKSRINTEFDIPINFDDLNNSSFESGTKQIFDLKGVNGLINWVKGQQKTLLTDTTFRDAHQSLLATRVRTTDMLRVAPAVSNYMSDLFSLEMWGGATFDVAYRFLQEDPWIRLKELRKRIPNILFQMLLRGNNTVGYKNYPDNVVKRFVKKSAENGIDIFRVFDSLNWIEGMRYAMDQVLENDKILEGTMCYTGDILDETRDKYTLQYYVDMAKELEKIGSHIIAIKDMSGLLKPYASAKLIKALKNEVSVPIHLHTHDTTGNGVATVLMAAEAGADIVDTAFNSMGGLTSQPALNSVVAALENTRRSTGVNLDNAELISKYWEAVRPVYANFESDLKSGSTEIYKYEIPGGQYSNFKPQVDSFGLGHRFKEVKDMYKSVNDMVGDIVKVTPSSKMVGDFAIFMVQNDLTPENIVEKGKFLDYPDSVVTYFKGMMGQPLGGFPEDIQKIVLKGEEPITVRAGELLPDEDFDANKKYLDEKYGITATEEDLLAYALYPKVFEDYLDNLKLSGDLSHVSSHVFFHGINLGQTREVEIEEGKTLIIKLVEMSETDDEGYVTLAFEINGNRREIKIFDKDSKKTADNTYLQLADPDNELEIGSSIPGTILKVLVNVGDKIKAGDPLMVVEAMKMETNIVSPVDGTVESIVVKDSEMVEAGQLLLRLE